MSDLVGNPEDRFSHNEAQIAGTREIRLNESLLTSNIIQLMYSFSVNIRICQPEKVMSTEAKPRWTSL